MVSRGVDGESGELLRSGRCVVYFSGAHIFIYTYILVHVYLAYVEYVWPGTPAEKNEALRCRSRPVASVINRTLRMIIVANFN